MASGANENREADLHPRTLTELAMGYFRSRALCAAARLDVAGALGDGERTADELASACTADRGALLRLLRALASFGIVTETTPGSFRLTEFGEPLRKDHPRSEWPSVVFWSDLLADSWSLLTECVRSGDRAMSVRPEGVPSRWSQDPNAQQIFHSVMGTAPAEDYLPIARAWDFSRYGSVADLGGGGGGLISAILRAYPSVRGMLVDRQPALDRASARFAQEGLLDRCELLAVDLADGVPPGAGVYLLKNVLHGYGDEDAVRILRHCRAVLPSGGRVLIVEYALPDKVDQADPALEHRLMSDLNMMVVTGGKERSELEWRTLVEASGLECLAVTPVAGDAVSIVEAGAVN